MKFFKGLIILLVGALFAVGQEGKEVYTTPFDIVNMVHLDLTALKLLDDPKMQPEDVRYLSLHNRLKANRHVDEAICNLVVNGLNPRYRKLIRMARVPAGAEDPVLLRCNLTDYGISPAAWDRLGEKGSGPVSIAEPYFHQSVDKLIDNFITVGVKTKSGKVKKIKKNQPINKSIFSHAFWLAIEPNEDDAGKTITDITEWTNSSSPILRADWFCTYAPWAPAYYDLIGLRLKDNPVKDDDAKKRPKVFLEKDFNALLHFDQKNAEEDITAAVTDTKIVTLYNRTLQRFNAVIGVLGGYYWRSQDTDNGLNQEDYLNQLRNFKKPKIKAQEIIANGRNGLNFYLLTDNKGRVLDVAAITIARHGDVMPTKFNDKQVFSARNCMLCHGAGMILPNDKVRAIAQDKIVLLIGDKTKNQKVAKAIDEAFYTKLSDAINLDNVRFTSAVLAATGFEAKAISRAYEDLVWQYYDQPVTLQDMARECGVAPDKLEILLKQGVNIDYTLTSVIQNPPIDVSRTTWENQGFRELMKYLYSKK